MAVPGWAWYGKSLAGANWILEQALSHDRTTWAVCAPTHRDVRQVCFEGTDSGIVSQALPGEIVNYNINNGTIELHNGSIIVGVSAEKDASIRGYNLSGVWFDELCSVRHDEFYYEGLIPALRKGDSRMCITTTPKSTRILRELVNTWKKREETGDYSVHLTRATTWENEENLSATSIAAFHRMYDGTTIGRQEIEGELLEDLAGALFSRSNLEQNTIYLDDVSDDMQRVVVAVDPATSSEERSDETGIVVVGSLDGHAYILNDYSLRGSPEECMSTAVKAYYTHSADSIVFEGNAGGDYLPSVLRHVNANVPWRMVRATRGKLTRAEPVAALAEQGRLHLTDGFDRGPLMDQLCAMVPGEKNGHDDRADALVWAVSELIDLSGGSYLEAYNMIYCAKCERPLKRDTKTCMCGEPVPPQEEKASLSAKRRKQPGGYSLPYVRYCEKGHLYPRFAEQCPDCGTVKAARYLKRITLLGAAAHDYLRHERISGLRSYYSGR